MERVDLGMDAGPELDRLIAEQIMGMESAGDDPALQWGEKGPMWRVPGRLWDRLPPFSTDIAAAWTVLERLADLGHVIHVKADGQRPKDRRYTIIDAALGGRVGPDEASAPLAICRAALAAVGAPATV